MTTFSITERPVDPLGRDSATAVFTNNGSSYDCAIGGQPFFLAASDQYPYRRETAQYQRQQYDQTREPGEQTLTGWWLRSQSSWHLGSGITFQESVSGENVIYRFRDSVGVDPWTLGKVSLLKATSRIYETTNGQQMFGALDGSSPVLFFSDGTALKRYATSASSVTWGGSNSIVSLTQDGTNYYAADSVGIYKGTLAGGNGAKIWDTGSANTTIAWVKQRLVAGIGASLYELVGTGTTLPTAIYTHPNSAWKWTAIVEGPTAIYAAGYAGTQSAIYRLSLGSNGAMPTLASAVTAADIPDDEYITGLATYLGTYILIGTTKGVRVGVIDNNGYIAYGPLTIETSSSVVSFAFRDRFAWCGVTNGVGGKSGAYRIDLSQEVENGRYAYATDIASTTTGNLTAVAWLPGTTRLAFAVTGSGVWLEEASGLVSSGWLRTGFIRHNTLEPKHFKFLKPRMASPIDGSLSLYSVQKNGTETFMVTLDENMDVNSDIAVSLPQQAELGFKFVLNRDAADSTLGPVLTGYQVKSLPAVKRVHVLSVPVLLFDYESDRFNVVTGYQGRAFERLQALESLEGSGDIVVFQDFTSGETVQCVIEKTMFERTSPPSRMFDGFGGIAYIQVRTTV